VGVGIGLVAGLIAFALVEIKIGSEEAAALFGGATALAILLTVLFGGLLAEVALRRSDADRPVSSALLAAASMVFAAAVYVGLTFAAGWLLSATV
jgi:hypothetical protein